MESYFVLSTFWWRHRSGSRWRTQYPPCDVVMRRIPDAEIPQRPKKKRKSTRVQTSQLFISQHLFSSYFCALVTVAGAQFNQKNTAHNSLYRFNLSHTLQPVSGGAICSQIQFFFLSFFFFFFSPCNWNKAEQKALALVAQSADAGKKNCSTLSA